ncbi:FAD synthase [Patescibacteria group bacterium]|nr:MAG: FAD synthase [Patescibacteria group bacterium]
MKKVMVFGTFDILHRGHEYVLKQAKKYGDYLVAVAARDTNVRKIKGRAPLNNEKTRVRNLKKLGLADKARLGYVRDPYKVITEEKPNVIALGYDQKEFVEGLKRFKNVKIVRLKAFKPNIYKSSKMRNEKNSYCDK